MGDSGNLNGILQTNVKRREGKLMQSSSIKTSRKSSTHTKKENIFDIINYIILFLIVYITFYPFWKIFVSSLSDPNLVLLNQIKWIPKGFTLDNYKIVFSNNNVLLAYWNTILYTVTGTAVSIVLTITTAYPLSRKNFFGKNVYMKLIIFAMLFSGGLIPTFLVVKSLGFYNKIWAIIIPGAISIWNLIITRTFFMNLPDSLEESATIDGANDIQILFQIYLPLSMPIIATMTLFYAVGHWNSYFAPLIYLNDKRKYPMQIFLRNILISSEMGQYQMQMEDTAVISTSIKYTVIMVTTLPILIVYPFIQKYFVKGVMVGAIKG